MFTKHAIHNSSITKLLITCLTVLTLITLAGCRQDKVPTHTAKGQLQIGTLSIADALPLYVAQEKGYFKDSGLNVTITPFKSSSAESQAMQAGKIDIMLNDMIVQSLLMKSNTDTKVIAMALGATPKEGRFAIIGAPTKDITSPAQLKGKKIALSNNTMMEYLTDRYLKYYHIDPKEVTYINMPNLLLRMETLLKGKEIDAAILPDPLAAIALHNHGTSIIDDTTLSINASQSVILGTNAWLTTQPEQVKAFLTAYNKAIAEINSHPEKYRELLLKIGHVPSEMATSYPMPTFTAKALPTEQEVQDLQNWLVEKGLLSKPYPYKDLVFTINK